MTSESETHPTTEKLVFYASLDPSDGAFHRDIGDMSRELLALRTEVERLRSRVEAAEGSLASCADLANSWARETSVREADRPSDLQALIDRLWGKSSAMESHLRAESDGARLALSRQTAQQAADAALVDELLRQIDAIGLQPNEETTFRFRRGKFVVRCRAARSGAQGYDASSVASPSQGLGSDVGSSYHSLGRGPQRRVSRAVSPSQDLAGAVGSASQTATPDPLHEATSSCRAAEHEAATTQSSEAIIGVLAGENEMLRSFCRRAMPALNQTIEPWNPPTPLTNFDLGDLKRLRTDIIVACPLAMYGDGIASRLPSQEAQLREWRQRAAAQPKAEEDEAGPRSMYEAWVSVMGARHPSWSELSPDMRSLWARRFTSALTAAFEDSP